VRQRRKALRRIPATGRLALPISRIVIYSADFREPYRSNSVFVAVLKPASQFLGPLNFSPKSSPSHISGDRLRDFTADRRLFLLTGMALVVGTAGAAAAWALMHLIYLATNLAYYGRVSAAPVSIAGNMLGLWSVLVPVA
jgi:hypothetical protein